MERTVGRSGVKRATIRDVAQLASVSVGTVSHVLNESKGVSDGARRAVHDAVKSLDYRPNSLARSLIARRPATSRSTTWSGSLRSRNPESVRPRDP